VRVKYTDELVKIAPAPEVEVNHAGCVGDGWATDDYGLVLPSFVVEATVRHGAKVVGPFLQGRRPFCSTRFVKCQKEKP
jgi:hypothetical protein